MVVRVGDSVQVYWPDEGWVKCTIDKMSSNRGVHVLYEDGDKEWISNDDLDQEGDQLMRHTKEEERREEAKTKKSKGGEATHACEIDGCSYVARRAGTLKRHQAAIHGVDVVFYPCNQEGCDYKSKEGGALTKHLANVHDIGVQWHECDQKGCSYKAKEVGTLRQHQAAIHDVDVVFFPCNQDAKWSWTLGVAMTGKRWEEVSGGGSAWPLLFQAGCGMVACDLLRLTTLLTRPPPLVSRPPRLSAHLLCFLC